MNDCFGTFIEGLSKNHVSPLMAKSSRPLETQINYSILSYISVCMIHDTQT